MKRFFLRGSLYIVIGLICILGVYELINYNKSLFTGEVRGLNEYNQWEYSMIKANPDYDDLKILVDISEKRLYLLNGNELIKKYPIASGKLETPSPIGSWKVINKRRMGSGFGTRWIGLDVPWGLFGIHGTNKPNSIGNDASAGCIRMRNKDVEDLYKYVKQGTPVAIVNGVFGPFGYGLNPIKPGDFGSDVIEVQRRLQALGYYKVDHLDGKYGPYMEDALYSFQKDYGLPKNPTITLETLKALGIVIME